MITGLEVNDGDEDGEVDKGLVWLVYLRRWLMVLSVDLMIHEGNNLKHGIKRTVENIISLMIEHFCSVIG